MRARAATRSFEVLVDKAEFDLFAEEYESLHRANIAASGEGPEYFARYKIAALSAFVKEAGVGAGRIVDFGSGIGNSIPHFREFFPASELTCADVSSRSIALAQTRFPGREQALLIENDRIPAPAGSFDVAFSACVFHHIPHDAHVAWLRELRRVTKDGGMLTIFEHNPLNPLTLQAVNTCPFDANAHLVRAGVLAARLRAAGWSNIATRYHLFFPRFLAFLRGAEPLLAGLPLGAQYSLTARKS